MSSQLTMNTSQKSLPANLAHYVPFGVKLLMIDLKAKLDPVTK